MKGRTIGVIGVIAILLTTIMSGYALFGFCEFGINVDAEERTFRLDGEDVTYNTNDASFPIVVRHGGHEVLHIMVDDTGLGDMEYQLREQTADMGEYDKSRIIMRIVNTLPYIPDDGEKWKKPVETMVQGGDCEDKAVLYVTLARSVGLTTKLCSEPNHVFAVTMIEGKWTRTDPTVSPFPGKALTTFTALPDSTDYGEISTYYLPAAAFECILGVYSILIWRYGSKEENE